MRANDQRIHTGPAASNSLILIRERKPGRETGRSEGLSSALVEECVRDRGTCRIFKIALTPFLQCLPFGGNCSPMPPVKRGCTPSGARSPQFLETFCSPAICPESCFLCFFNVCVKILLSEWMDSSTTTETVLGGSSPELGCPLVNIPETHLHISNGPYEPWETLKDIFEPCYWALF